MQHAPPLAPAPRTPGTTHLYPATTVPADRSYVSTGSSNSSSSSEGGIADGVPASHAKSGAGARREKSPAARSTTTANSSSKTSGSFDSASSVSSSAAALRAVGDTALRVRGSGIGHATVVSATDGSGGGGIVRRGKTCPTVVASGGGGRGGFGVASTTVKKSRAAKCLSRSCAAAAAAPSASPPSSLKTEDDDVQRMVDRIKSRNHNNGGGRQAKGGRWTCENRMGYSFRRWCIRYPFENMSTLLVAAVVEKKSKQLRHPPAPDNPPIDMFATTHPKPRLNPTQRNPTQPRNNNIVYTKHTIRKTKKMQVKRTRPCAAS